MDNIEMEKTEKVKSKKKEKSEKKGFPDLRLNFKKYIESLQSNWKALLFTAFAVILFMMAITFAVFFAFVKSPEEVLVPNVVNKPLEEALQDMQVKELYPKIQLRYSNTQSDKGYVLEQDPPAGAIVKAQRHIDLVVSKGAVIDRVGNYVGQKLDDVKLSLQALMAESAIPLIKLPDVPNYR
ncbi:MAG: PASTA domain-containing protein, partial [Spirochaetaceae bacterium]|nr:PASTA domain-containing protein [Spirochaetaceae bacterium]